MAETVARTSGSGEDTMRVVARLGGAVGVDATPAGADSAGGKAPAYKGGSGARRGPAVRPQNVGSNEPESDQASNRAADDARAQTASSNGGLGGGALVGEDDEQRHGPPGRRRGAVTPARRSGSGAMNEVEQRRGGALPERSIPDETQQLWTMRRDFDEAR
ncbi:hypothetical protein Scep_005116 [Stephania cephalantha]|uniref:Uncharacterized protein n=1 Tax=Stephania cephalantha TaxID=152367 RepID=A0AAP0PW19_9MAGN